MLLTTKENVLLGYQTETYIVIPYAGKILINMSSSHVDDRTKSQLTASAHS